MLTEPPAAPAQTHGRAGRNLPAAIGIGVGLGAYVVLSLVYLKPAFVALVAAALILAAVELHEALKKQAMTSAETDVTRWLDERESHAWRSYLHAHDVLTAQLNRQLLNQSEDLRQIENEWERFWMVDQPSHMTYERVHGVLQ